MDKKKGKLHTLMKEMKERGIKTSEESLWEDIFEFALKREEEFILMLQKRDAEQLLKSWLEHPVVTEYTDAVTEHDAVL